LTVSKKDAVMWDIRSPRYITSLHIPNDFEISSSMWHHNHSNILLGSHNSQLQVWDYRKNKPLLLNSYDLGSIQTIDTNSYVSIVGLVFTTTLITLNQFYEMKYQYKDFDTSSIQSSYMEQFVWKLF
jgi:WD40 repeat protein